MMIYLMSRGMCGQAVGVWSREVVEVFCWQWVTQDMLSSSAVMCQGWVTKYLEHQICLSAATLKEMEFHLIFCHWLWKTKRFLCFHTFFSLMKTIWAMTKEACPMLQAWIGSLTLQWHALFFILYWANHQERSKYTVSCLPDITGRDS